MAELEIHHEGGHIADPMGQRVGILASLLAVLLAIVTIASHRTHTAAIMHKSGANDAWSHYQATRVIAAGLMDLTPAGGFEAWRPVSGPEAVAVVEELVRLVGP